MTRLLLLLSLALGIATARAADTPTYSVSIYCLDEHGKETFSATIPRFVMNSVDMPILVDGQRQIVRVAPEKPTPPEPPYIFVQITDPSVILPPAGPLEILEANFPWPADDKRITIYKSTTHTLQLSITPGDQPQVITNQPKAE